VGKNCVASPASAISGSASLRPRPLRPQLKRDPLGGYAGHQVTVRDPDVFRHSPLIASLGLVGAVLSTPSGPPQVPSVPAFADYAVDSVYHGSLAPVDLASSPKARRFRTVLRRGAEEGPNYAGHLTVVTWGCGTSCIDVALVDARTGRVTPSPIGAGYGVQHHLDSRLLVIDRVPCSDTSWAAPYAVFLEWTGRALRILDSLPNSRICGA